MWEGRKTSLEWRKIAAGASAENVLKGANKKESLE